MNRCILWNFGPHRLETRNSWWWVYHIGEDIVTLSYCKFFASIELNWFQLFPDYFGPFEGLSYLFSWNCNLNVEMRLDVMMLKIQLKMISTHNEISSAFFLFKRMKNVYKMAFYQREPRHTFFDWKGNGSGKCFRLLKAMLICH